MPSVFIIEEKVDYEGDTLVSIHATHEGALTALGRKHADLCRDQYCVYRKCMRTEDFRVRDRVFQISEKTLEV